MLNWNVCYRSVFDSKTVLILKGIVWNRTVYLHKNGFGIRKPTMVDMP